MSDLLEHASRNRAYWDDLARQYVEAGERAWAKEEPAWGIWQVPEAELQIFSEQLADKDAIELGCGTAYVSAWLSRRGARVVGIDNSQAQLEAGYLLSDHLKALWIQNRSLIEAECSGELWRGIELLPAPTVWLVRRSLEIVCRAESSGLSQRCRKVIPFTTY